MRRQFERQYIRKVLEKVGGCVSMLFTDVNLAGKIDGVELAHFATQCYPNIHVIVTSGLARQPVLPFSTGASSSARASCSRLRSTSARPVRGN